MAINDYLRTSSFDVEGNLNFRRLAEKRRYNNWLLGDALRLDLGHETNNSDGSAIDNPTSTPPGWTQHHAGRFESFVITPLSSSEHEKSSINAFLSGVVPLETTVVPASASVYYSKRSMLQKKIYKLSASADLTSILPAHVSSFTASLGSLFSGSVWQPAIFSLDVPDYGKIVDVRVWVELLNFSGSAVDEGAGSDYTTNYYGSPLGVTVIALRSPNTTGFISFPILNDTRIKSRNTLDPALYDTFDSDSGAGLPSIFYNSFILWLGRSGSDSMPISTWQKDRHMRTVFHDSSFQLNPGHLDELYKLSGVSDHDWTRNATGSPNDVANGNGTYIGNAVPWISDERLPSASSYTAPGSPPEGWLTAPGVVFAAGEFPTTGSNFGPANIRPYYPLLSEILEVQDNAAAYSETSFQGTQARIKKWQGIRPGLKGREMHGTWDLMISTSPFASTDFQFTNPTYGAVQAYFRQWRLEITYETRGALRSDGVRYSRPGEHWRSRRLAITSGSYSTSKKDNRTRVFTVAGFADGVENFVYEVPSTNEYGTTIGITDNTGSNIAEYAVFSRLTGSLAQFLSGSEHAHVKYKFIHNEFGTPQIPIVSGSAAGFSFIVDVQKSNNKKLIGDILSPNAIIEKAHTLRTVMSRTGESTKKTRDLVTEKISGSL